MHPFCMPKLLWGIHSVFWATLWSWSHEYMAGANEYICLMLDVNFLIGQPFWSSLDFEFALHPGTAAWERGFYQLLSEYLYSFLLQEIVNIINPNESVEKLRDWYRVGWNSWSAGRARPCLAFCSIVSLFAVLQFSHSRSFIYTVMLVDHRPEFYRRF